MIANKEVQDLLDRYWEGETTLEEERRLKAYFAQERVPEQFRREAQWFRALQADRSVEMPGQPAVVAPSRRFRWISWAAAAAVVSFLTVGSWLWMNKKQPEQQLPVAATAQPALPAAPVAATPDSVYAAVRQMPPASPKTKRRPKTQGPVHQIEDKPADTYDDPEQALAEIKAALALVSAKINKSRKEAEKGLQEMDNVEILLKKKKEING